MVAADEAELSNGVDGLWMKENDIPAIATTATAVIIQSIVFLNMKLFDYIYNAGTDGSFHNNTPGKGICNAIKARRVFAEWNDEWRNNAKCGYL